MIEAILSSDAVEKLIQGTAVAILGAFLPICQKAVNAIVEFLKERQNDSASLAVLSSALAATIVRAPCDKDSLLMIEDNRMDAFQLQSVCGEILQEGQYATITTPTLAGAYEHTRQARVIIIDIGLPDASELLVRRFIAEMGPIIPIIIWSANEYTKEQFPEAYAITKKTDPIDQVVGIVKKAMAQRGRV